MEDHVDTTNEVNVNLAMHYGDDSTSVSTALMKARKTALNKFNNFLAATNINGGEKYDRETFPVELVNESLVGKTYCTVNNSPVPVQNYATLYGSGIFGRHDDNGRRDGKFSLTLVFK